MLYDDGGKQELWVGIKESINEQPVPLEETRVVDIKCNDCEVSELNRRWHPLGLDCSSCGSFNTTLMDIKMVGVEANEFLEQLERSRRRRRRRRGIATSSASISTTTTASTTAIELRSNPVVKRVRRIL